jgi:uncharacterized protein (DUF983 family)
MMSNVIHLKSCPRCRGDMMLEQYLGDSEFVCLQCGHRSALQPQAKPAPAAVATRKAA